MNKIRKNKVTKSTTVGYIRTSLDEQAIVSQKLEILEYCRVHNLSISKWVELEVSAQKSASQKRTEESLGLVKGDILVVSEISRLGRSTPEVLGLVNHILRNGIRIIFTRQELDLALTSQNNEFTKTILIIFSMLATLERDIISLRIKETLFAKKRRGLNIGKVRGTIQSSIYDTKKEQILFLLSKEISVFDISRIIGIGKPRSLLIYLNKRKLREEKKLKKKIKEE